MDARAQKEEDRWERIGENFDSLFAQVDASNKNQQRLEVQFGLSNSVVEQMLKDQQLLAKQMEVTDGGNRASRGSTYYQSAQSEG